MGSPRRYDGRAQPISVRAQDSRGWAQGLTPGDGSQRGEGRTGGQGAGLLAQPLSAERLVHDPQAAGLRQRDHLHPNDAGYAAMGNSIDLGLFTSEDEDQERSSSAGRSP